MRSAAVTVGYMLLYVQQVVSGVRDCQQGKQGQQSGVHSRRVSANAALLRQEVDPEEVALAVDAAASP